MNGPAWIVLMTESHPPAGQSAWVCVLGEGGEPTNNLDRAELFDTAVAARDTARWRSRDGRYCCTAVPTGPGVPALAWDEKSRSG